ncbi:Coiled-coil domain-containing protein 28B [Sarcoptes scabiei]|uniref:Coiled-coil domain-containing protein 28B n=1 Tax=Sarcoptes scabiei TaxID=52283 RepID=A0A834VIA9_SARSC|nr:Coiled-coil domain-containing protein 28B [Sarcoptes scabiei]
MNFDLKHKLSDDGNIHRAEFTDLFDVNDLNSDIVHCSDFSISYYTLNSLNFKPNFLKEFTDVNQTEKSLSKLLNDFHQEKMKAFDEQITMSDMIRVREKQQQLARLHFELNNQQTNEKTSISMINNDSMIVSKQSSIDRSTREGEDLSRSNVEQISSVKFDETKEDDRKIDANTGDEKMDISVPKSNIKQSNHQQNVERDSFRFNRTDQIDRKNDLNKSFPKSNMTKLVQKLQNLCQLIELLQAKNNRNESF